MSKWFKGNTAPQDGTAFIAAWKDYRGNNVGNLVTPGSVINTKAVPGDFKILRRVWWDGQHVYSDPDYWMPLPEDDE